MNAISSQRAIRFVTLSIVACGLCENSMAADQHGIPNFAQVAPGIWRGGQPTIEGWMYLKSLGVKRDVKLNTENEATDNAAKTNGIQVIFLPITLGQQTIGKPQATMIKTAVDAIKADGTYIHCEHGQDRTGLIVGAYRVKVEHWTKSAAYQEMQAHGFHPALHGLYRAWQEDILEERPQAAEKPQKPL